MGVNMVYQWKDGSRKSGDADKIGKEVESLGPAVNAESVVERASAETSAMHGCFEWDDSAAATEYRLNQARELIRSLVIVVESKHVPGESVTIRAYEHVDRGIGKNPQMAYVPTQKALSVPALCDQVIARLYGTITEAEETARKYEYLSGGIGRARQKLSEAREELHA
jgi:hypothetical protein